MGDKKLSKNIVGVAISGPSSKYVVDAIVEAVVTVELPVGS